MPSTAGDVRRYWTLAESILGGDFAIDGRPSVGFAPGYPAFLALALSTGAGFEAVLALQFAVSLATILLVWLAARPFSRAAALVAVGVLAFTPELAARAGQVLSEGLSLFLVALLCGLVSVAVRRGPRPGLGLGLGLVAAALPLTAPHLVLVLGATVLWVLHDRAWNWRARVAFGLGCAALVVPWQAWVTGIQGRPSWTLLELGGREYAFARSGYAYWLRQWYETPRDVQRTLFHLPRAGRFPIAGLPPGLSQRDVAHLCAAAEEPPWSLPSSSLEEYRGLGRQLLERQSAASRAFRAVRRAAWVWFEPQIDAVWGALDASLAGWPRGAKRALWWWNVAANGLLLVTLAASALAGLRAKGPARLFVAAALAYTLVTVTRSFPEVRRNLPFVPLLLVGGVLHRRTPAAGPRPLNAPRTT